MSLFTEIILSALLLVASFFALVGSIGLVKLSDFFKRLHAPTKATTMGVGSILIVSIFYHALVGNSFHPREVLISVFLIITA
ncbi:MAG: Na+/H+ antiporter subunit G, partial [Gammaproteobacteria bacterium]|nr:Na+/H+ antiporter subunit G [Gammaproteobacteria bacterium]